MLLDNYCAFDIHSLKETGLASHLEGERGAMNALSALAQNARDGCKCFEDSLAAGKLKKSQDPRALLLDAVQKHTLQHCWEAVLTSPCTNQNGDKF